MSIIWLRSFQLPAREAQSDRSELLDRTTRLSGVKLRWTFGRICFTTTSHLIYNPSHFLLHIDEVNASNTKPQHRKRSSPSNFEVLFTRETGQTNETRYTTHHTHGRVGDSWKNCLPKVVQRSRSSRCVGEGGAVVEKTGTRWPRIKPGRSGGMMDYRLGLLLLTRVVDTQFNNLLLLV